MTAATAAEPKPCANCGATLAGAWCHACGQQGHLHHKVSDLAKEIVEGVAHLDGRVFRTAPLLALNPGRLSREWMEGKRQRFIPPLHVFLFGIFLLFLIPTFTGNRLFDVGTSGGAVQVNLTTQDSLRFSAPTLQRMEAFAQAFRGKAKDGKYYSYRIEGLAYKLAVVLAPLGMVILAVATLRRSRRYTFYQHGVVALYGMGFAALMMSLVNLTSGGTGQLMSAVAGIALPVHAVAHVRGAYGFSRWQALLRALVVGVLTLVIFFFFVVGVTLLGMFG